MGHNSGKLCNLFVQGTRWQPLNKKNYLPLQGEKGSELRRIGLWPAGIRLFGGITHQAGIIPGCCTMMITVVTGCAFHSECKEAQAYACHKQ